jgi:exosome complex RNA-binding protein Rrp42 (RNase PH superfamily)
MKKNYFQLKTDILVGIKADIGVPSPDRPHEGKLEFFVDW